MPDFDEAEFDRVMAINARGAFLGMKYTLPHMRDGTAIVNIASVSGIAGYPMVAAYVASKHAAASPLRAKRVCCPRRRWARRALKARSLRPP
jgi:NAD(P)-dependent dehydrogenase (short-subunit alcohol dehydrogenase family)